MTTELPDVKLRALVNFPVSVAGRTAIAIEKTSGRYYLDLDVSGLVQNTNISADEVDQSWMLIWNETTDAYELVPYALAATSGVASIDGKTGALDLGYRLRFTGDTLEVDQTEFDTKNAAESYAPAVYPSSIVLRGHTTIGDGAGGLFADLGTSPTHDLTVNVGTKTYVRVPAAVAEPANIFEVGIDPQDATPGWNRMIAAWKASGYSNWYIPQGLIFNQRPDDINSRPSRDQQELYTFNLKGNGAYRTTLYKNFESLNGTDEGILNIRQNDVHISDMQFISLSGSRNAANTAGTGCFISAVAPNHSIGYGSIRDIDMTSGGGPGNAYHSLGMYFNGGLGSAATGLGIRGYELSNIKIFGGGIGAAQFDNIAALTWMGGSTHTAGGDSGAIFFTGIDKPTPAVWSNVIAYLASDDVMSGGLYYRALTNNINKTPASNPSDWELQSLTTVGAFYANVQLSVISGGVSCQKAQSIRVTAGELSGGSISFTSDSVDCHVRGRLAGGATISNSGTNCTVNGSQIVETSATNGYIRFEDGTIEQWMQVTVTTGAVAYNFPIAFPTQCFSLDVTTQSSSASANVTVASGGFTASQVTLIGTGAVNVIVRAKGR